MCWQTCYQRWQKEQHMKGRTCSPKRPLPSDFATAWRDIQCPDQHLPTMGSSTVTVTSQGEEGRGVVLSPRSPLGQLKNSQSFPLTLHSHRKEENLKASSADIRFLSRNFLSV